jgi:hypothetical protein
MRVPFLAAIAATLWSALPVAAQRPTASTSKSSAAPERIALSSREEASAAPMRLACAPIVGNVFDPNGKALVGATLLIKGTHQVYVTDSEGKFAFTEPVYEGQVLTVGAAGYTPLDVPLTDCALPRLVLQQSEGAQIKRKGKRSGQVIRLNNRSTNLK